MRDRSLEVAWIAELVGYGGPQVFTPAFKRYAGMTPTEYRRLARRRAPAAEPEESRWVPDAEPGSWRRFVLGMLELQDATRLFRHFLATYPEIRRRLFLDMIARLGGRNERQADRHGAALIPTPLAEAEVDRLVPALGEVLTREDLEQLLAEATWSDLRRLPWPEQLDRVRHHLGFATPAFFRFLGEESERLAPQDPEAALRLARLALEHAALLHPADADDGTHPWKALGWAWIGNAKREAGDLGAAAKAFVAAERRLGDDLDRSALAIRSEVSRLASAGSRLASAASAAPAQPAARSSTQ